VRPGSLAEACPHASASLLRLNPQLAEQLGGQVVGVAVANSKPAKDGQGHIVEIKPATILRQRRGQPSKTEQAFETILRTMHKGAWLKEQGLTLPLANGLRYTPDFVVVTPANDGVHLVIAYEVKGARIWDGSTDKLKVAAHEFPWIKFMLARRKKHTEPFAMQEVLP
jgi:hypothetical protein